MISKELLDEIDELKKKAERPNFVNNMIENGNLKKNG